MWQWNFGFYKMQGISRLAEDLLASEEGPCSMELVSYVVNVLYKILL
jgi:hypothetical protein